jgi:hypothetical protein
MTEWSEVIYQLTEPIREADRLDGRSPRSEVRP